MRELGLLTLRDLSMAFSGQGEQRQKELHGLAGELVVKLPLSEREIVDLLSCALDMAVGAESASFNSPILTGEFLKRRRPLGGVWVEDEPEPKKAAVRLEVKPCLPGSSVLDPSVPLGGRQASVLRAVARSVVPGFSPVQDT